MNCWLFKRPGFDPVPILCFLSASRTRSPRLNSSSLESCHIRFTLKPYSEKKRKVILAANLAQHTSLKLQRNVSCGCPICFIIKPSLEGFAPFGLTLQGRAGVERRKRKRRNGMVKLWRTGWKRKSLFGKSWKKMHGVYFSITFCKYVWILKEAKKKNGNHGGIDRGRDEKNKKREMRRGRGEDWPGSKRFPWIKLY